MRENPTVCASSDFWKDTGMRSTKKGGKDTLSGKIAAAVPAAGKG